MLALGDLIVRERRAQDEGASRTIHTRDIWMPCAAEAGAPSLYSTMKPSHSLYVGFTLLNA